MNTGSSSRDIYNMLMNLEVSYGDFRHEYKGDKLLFLANLVGVWVSPLSDVKEKDLMKVTKLESILRNMNRVDGLLSIVELNEEMEKLQKIYSLFKRIAGKDIDIQTLYVKGKCVIDNLDELLNEDSQRILSEDYFGLYWGSINKDGGYYCVDNENIAPFRMLMMYDRTKDIVVDMRNEHKAYNQKRIQLLSYNTIQDDMKKSRSKPTKELLSLLLDTFKNPKDLAWHILEQLPEVEWNSLDGKKISDRIKTYNKGELEVISVLV